MIRIFNMVGFGNYHISVWMNTEIRNENELSIWNNTVGASFYKCSEIWDSDLTKIVRILKRFEYSRMDIKEISHILNRDCRHLNIYNY